MSAWKNAAGDASNIHWSMRLCCVFSWAKALNQRLRAERAKKAEPIRRVHVVALTADADEADRAR